MKTWAIAIAALGFTATSATAADVWRRPFGTMPDGTPVEAITLSNPSGSSATIITLGASVQSLLVKDRAGKLADVVLGYPDLAGYIAKPNYFGATVGRVANRIARGRFTLDGKTYETPLSDGPNSLHGGTRGFDKLVWKALSDIPFGQTTSYGAVTKAIGHPMAARAVGAANGANPIALIVPCHRVIGSDGSLTGFGGGLPLKRRLLEHEARVCGTRYDLFG